MEILIIALLILLNGVFSMAEIALVSARKARLEAQANKGDKKPRMHWRWPTIQITSFLRYKSELH
ncbi:CNNM domain-containing protein [Niabella sp. W65]|nr:CNNM domain-containing protein [Niabella sp. W65]MCH7361646.1 CNNM domain-containing protein [Niabella sp. W65]ULT45426.1 CNNM domain-containing protein [Niabella sp. I65]